MCKIVCHNTLFEHHMWRHIQFVGDIMIVQATLRLWKDYYSWGDAGTHI